MTYLTVTKKLIATYGTKMRGRAFKIIFCVLDGAFESVETSPEFAQFQKADEKNKIVKSNRSLIDLDHLTIFSSIMLKA